MSAITAENVSEGFDEAATRYDLMVALNPGYHRHLRRAADGLVAWLPGQPAVARVVDLGCGSGASTRAVQRSLEAAGRRHQVIGVDASVGMLEQARAKAWPAEVDFALGSAGALADSGIAALQEQQSGVLAAYLFRNVVDRDSALAEVHDLLGDGGVLVVEEYSVAGSARAALIWSMICWLVVIPLSWLLQRRTRLYRYLWRSVLDFDSVQTFVDRLYAAGFTDVEVRTVPGWQSGILHMFRARKPAAGGSR